MSDMQYINNNFLNPLKKGINYYFKVLDERKLKHVESINLLKQCDITLKNAKKLLEKNQFTDANTLLRSAYEYLMMGMTIQFDENVFEEFKKIGLEEKDRNFTKPSNVKKVFRDNLRTISPELFDDMSNRELNKILDGLYNHLSNYTHSSIIVSTLVNFEKEEKEIICDFLYINYYLIYIFLYYSLKYISKTEKDYLNLESLIISFFVYIVLIFEKMSNMNLDFNKYKESIYPEENAKFLYNNEKELINYKNKLEELTRYIKNKE